MKNCTDERQKRKRVKEKKKNSAVCWNAKAERYVDEFAVVGVNKYVNCSVFQFWLPPKTLPKIFFVSHVVCIYIYIPPWNQLSLHPDYISTPIPSAFINCSAVSLLFICTPLQRAAASPKQCSSVVFQCNSVQHSLGF